MAGLASAYRYSGDLDEASKMIETMMEREEEVGAPYAPGRGHAFAAAVATDRDQFAEALPLFREGLSRFRGVPGADDVVWVVQWYLIQGARLMHHLGEPVIGATLLGAADASLRTKGYVRKWDEQEELDTAYSGVRESIEPHEFEAASQKGEETDPGEALRLLAEMLEQQT